MERKPINKDFWCENIRKNFTWKQREEKNEQNQFDRNNLKGNALQTIMVQPWNVTTINSKLKQLKNNKCRNIDKYPNKNMLAIEFEKKYIQKMNEILFIFSLFFN